MKFIKKHPKFCAVVGALIAVLAILAVIARHQTLSNTTEMKLANNPRMDKVFTDTFYSDQLNEKERAAYDMIIERMERKEGGVIEFKEPLTGREYTRIITAIQNEGGGYFYAFCDIPLNQDDIYLEYDGTKLLDIKEAEVAKVILFVSCSEGINEFGTYAEDGTVRNLDEIAELMPKINADKLAEIEADEAAVLAELDEIIAGIPKDAGEKDTLNYFMDWIAENIEYHSELSMEATKFTTMEEVVDIAYRGSTTACVLEGEATMLGYTKLLSYLCNQAGMESHVELGSWGRNGQEGYTMTVVKINGENIYVDASGVKSSKLAGNRYLNEQEALTHMNRVEYFNYDE